MASEADEKPSGNDVLDNKEPHKGALDRLSKDYRELSDKAQQLLTEKLFLENELTQLKKRSNRLEEELSNIRTPPLIIGYIQDVVNEQAIVRSSNGTVFLVSINRRLDSTKIKPGTRVALNQDTLSVVEILSDSWDPLVSNAEIIDSPDVHYSSIGGLEKQIRELKEAIELPFENPEAFSDFGIDPPLGGWAAATGHLDFSAWALFFIMFLWQHPHFYAIAWMCKEDYARVNLKCFL